MMHSTDELIDKIKLFIDATEAVNVYPYVIRPSVLSENLYDLTQFFFLYREGTQNFLRRTKRGDEEVARYLRMLSDPSERLPIIRLVRGMSMLPQVTHQELIIVDSYKVALREGVLSSYMKGHDFLYLITDLDKGVGFYEYRYANDYCEYIKATYTNSTEGRIELGRSYLKFVSNRSVKKKYEEVNYDESTLDGALKAISQMGQYEYVLSQIKLPIYLPSDGLGVASAYCMMSSKKYRSSEPNDIGSIPYRLGIITEKQVEVRDDYVYVFFYCAQYYAIPMFMNQRYLIIDVPIVKRVGRRMAHNMSGNYDIDLTQWDLVVTQFSYMKLDRVYALDERTKRILGSTQTLVTDIVSANFVVVFDTAIFETLVDVGYFNIERHLDTVVAHYREATRARQQFERNVVLDETLRSKVSEIRKELDHGSTVERLNAKLKLFRLQYGLDPWELQREFRAKVVILTDRHFPFRSPETQRSGRPRVDVSGVVSPYENSRVVVDGYFSSRFGLFTSRGYITKYEYYEGIFLCKLSHPTTLKYIYLSQEDALRFPMNPIRVVLLHTVKLGVTYLCSYCYDLTKKPRILC